MSMPSTPKEKKARGANPPQDQGLYLRVSRELMRKIDEAVATRRQGAPGLNVSRSGVVRELLLRVLAEKESL